MLDRPLEILQERGDARRAQILGGDPLGLAEGGVDLGDHREKAGVGVGVGVAPPELPPLRVTVGGPPAGRGGHLGDVEPAELLRRIPQRPRHRLPHRDHERDVDERRGGVEELPLLHGLPVGRRQLQPGLVAGRPEVGLDRPLLELIELLPRISVAGLHDDRLAPDAVPGRVELLDHRVDPALLGARADEEHLDGPAGGGRSRRRGRGPRPAGLRDPLEKSGAVQAESGQARDGENNGEPEQRFRSVLHHACPPGSGAYSTLIPSDRQSAVRGGS